MPGKRASVIADRGLVNAERASSHAGTDQSQLKIAQTFKD